jgi:hypothetical protein
MINWQEEEYPRLQRSQHPCIASTEMTSAVIESIENMSSKRETLNHGWFHNLHEVSWTFSPLLSLDYRLLFSNWLVCIPNRPTPTIIPYRLPWIYFLLNFKPLDFKIDAVKYLENRNKHPKFWYPMTSIWGLSGLPEKDNSRPYKTITSGEQQLKGVSTTTMCVWGHSLV